MTNRHIFTTLTSAAILLFTFPPTSYAAETKQLSLTPPPGGHMELPFSIVSVSDTLKLINISTGWTYNCRFSGNVLMDTITLQSGNCHRSVSGNSHLFSPANMPQDEDWKRNYLGTFTNHLITVGGTKRLISLNHGENKNEIINGNKYQNSINKNVLVSDCASGIVNGVYQDCIQAYNKFVTLSWQYADTAHDFGTKDQIDEGPILWPANGYTYGGGKSGAGIGHPHGLIDQGYIYIFYDEMSSGNTWNRGGGIKMARAPIASGGLPGSFTTYCDGQWVPSLPAGFDKSRLHNFLSIQGGCASPIIPYEANTYSFAVAKKTTGGYLGVKAMYGSSGSILKLYESETLTNWQLLKTIEQETSNPERHLMYPLFLNDTASSTEIVNPRRYYLIGSSGGNINIIEIVSPGKPGDLNEDGKVDIFDFNLLVANFDNPYTIFDFNTLVTNFGR